VKACLLAIACAAPLLGLVVIEPALGWLVLVVRLATMIVLSGLRLRILAGLVAIVGVTIAAAGGLHLLQGYQLKRFTPSCTRPRTCPAPATTRHRPRSRWDRAGCSAEGLFHGQLIAGNFVPAQQTTSSSRWRGRARLRRRAHSSCSCSASSSPCAADRGPGRRQFGMLVASGIAVGSRSSTSVNIGMTIASMPSPACPLPFLSYGGSLADLRHDRDRHAPVRAPPPQCVFD